MNFLSAKPLLLLVAVISGCQATGSSSFQGNVNEVRICSGFGCIYEQNLAFTVEDIAYMRSVMSTGKSDAVAERTAFADLVAWKERLAQTRLRMRQDTRLTYQRDQGIRGQMDCVDEANNTMAFLRFLERKGMLAFNKPTRIVERGFLFDGRYPHRTAIVTDDSGEEWAIDSWKEDGGELPQVVELAIWKKERGSEYR